MLKRTVNNDGIVADFFLPETEEKRKTIIMLGGSEGGKSWSRINQVLSRLSERGYNLLSTAYFKAAGLSATLEEIPLERFEKLFSWLDQQPEVIPGHYALIGGSKGAELALLLASRYPQIKAVAAISPSSVIWQGIPKNRFHLGRELKSSWSYQGVGIPYLPYLITRKDTRALISLRLRKIHERALQHSGTAELNDASIPIEQAKAAIMLVSGAKDQMWPAAEMGEEIISRLHEKAYRFPYQHLQFNSGHNGLIMNRESWRQIFAFLGENF